MSLKEDFEERIYRMRELIEGTRLFTYQEIDFEGFKTTYFSEIEETNETQKYYVMAPEDFLAGAEDHVKELYTRYNADNKVIEDLKLQQDILELFEKMSKFKDITQLEQKAWSGVKSEIIQAAEANEWRIDFLETWERRRLEGSSHINLSMIYFLSVLKTDALIKLKHDILQKITSENNHQKRVNIEIQTWVKIRQELINEFQTRRFSKQHFEDFLQLVDEMYTAVYAGELTQVEVLDLTRQALALFQRILAAIMQKQISAGKYKEKPDEVNEKLKKILELPAWVYEWGQIRQLFTLRTVPTNNNLKFLKQFHANLKNLKQSSGAVFEGISDESLLVQIERFFELLAKFDLNSLPSAEFSAILEAIHQTIKDWLLSYFIVENSKALEFILKRFPEIPDIILLYIADAIKKKIVDDPEYHKWLNEYRKDNTVGKLLALLKETMDQHGEEKIQNLYFPTSRDHPTYMAATVLSNKVITQFIEQTIFEKIHINESNAKPFLTILEEAGIKPQLIVTNCVEPITVIDNIIELFNLEKDTQQKMRKQRLPITSTDIMNKGIEQLGIPAKSLYLAFQVKETAKPENKKINTSKQFRISFNEFQQYIDHKFNLLAELCRSTSNKLPPQDISTYLQGERKAIERFLTKYLLQAYIILSLEKSQENEFIAGLNAAISYIITILSMDFDAQTYQSGKETLIIHDVLQDILIEDPDEFIRRILSQLHLKKAIRKTIEESVHLITQKESLNAELIIEYQARDRSTFILSTPKDLGIELEEPRIVVNITELISRIEKTLTEYLQAHEKTLKSEKSDVIKSELTNLIESQLMEPWELELPVILVQTQQEKSEEKMGSIIQSLNKKTELNRIQGNSITCPNCGTMFQPSIDAAPPLPPKTDKTSNSNIPPPPPPPV